MGIRFLLAALIAGLCTGESVRPQMPLTGRAVSGVPERVRTTNSRIRQALREGQDKASTFRSLLQQLERSDVVLYIEPGECTCATAHSCLTFVTTAGSIRYLRVIVTLKQIQRELIAHIGHELRHAIEIAGAAEVVDNRSLRRLYQERASQSCGRPCGFETEAAMRTQAAVRTELRNASGSPRPDWDERSH
jgi:hypothetical protein